MGFRWIAVSAGVFALLPVTAVVLQSGPDVSRADAEDLCSDWATQNMPGLSRSGIDVEVATLDAGGRTWTVSGTAASRDMTGPFSCTMNWAPGAPVVYLDHIELPNGHVSDIDSVGHD